MDQPNSELDHFRVLDRDANDVQRIAFAAATRDVLHSFTGHEVPTETVEQLSLHMHNIVVEIDSQPRRDRLAIMRAAMAAHEGENFAVGTARAGYEDRAVAGKANPASIEFNIDFQGSVGLGGDPDPYQDVVATFVLRKAFEGAPGRAHGGMVAAAFDDVTGWVIGRLGEPAFTGEISVRFQAPVPIDELLEIRTRLVNRERRKLFITAELHSPDGTVVATCRATYITVDPKIFAGAPEPR